MSRAIPIKNRAYQMGGRAVAWSVTPDSVVSRPQDDNTLTGVVAEDEYGIRISTSQSWESIDARLSANGTNRRYGVLRRVSDDTVLDEVDIDSLSSGDVFTFSNVNLSANEEYDINVKGIFEWDSGNLQDASFPFVSSDGELEIINGTFHNDSDPSTATRPDAHNIIEVGRIK